MNRKTNILKVISAIVVQTLFITGIAWSGEMKTNYADKKYLSPKINISIDTLKNSFQSHLNTKPLEKEKISYQRKTFLQKERNLFIKKMIVAVPLFLIGLSAIILGFVFFYNSLGTIFTPISTLSADYVRDNLKTFIKIFLSISGIYFAGGFSKTILSIFQDSFFRYYYPYSWWKDRFNNGSMQTEKRIQAANALVLLKNRGAIAFLVQHGLFDKDIIIADGVLDILIKYNEYKQKVINNCMSNLTHELQEIKDKNRLFRSIEILGNLRYLGAIEILNDYAIHSDPEISDIARQSLQKIGFSKGQNKAATSKERAFKIPTHIIPNTTFSKIRHFNTESFTLCVLQAI